MAQQIAINALDGSGSFNAYLAKPAGTPRGAIVVVQEIFGVNAGIRKMCDDWANDGYLALAHDMFWRMEPGFESDPDDYETMQKAFGFYSAFDTDKGVADIEATIKKARELVGGGKVGVVGYCMGGKMAYLAATRTDADTSVAYYGGGIDEFVNEGHAIAQPLLMHFGTSDKYIGPDAQKAIREALGDNRHVTIHWYEGVDHAFARASGHDRVEHAAELADSRTRAFIAAHLG